MDALLEKGSRPKLEKAGKDFAECFGEDVLQPGSNHGSSTYVQSCLRILCRDVLLAVNPKMGPAITKAYLERGNSVPFQKIA